MVKSQPADAGDTGSIPGLGRSPGEGNGTLVFLSWNAHGQRSLVDYGPWGSQKNWTQLNSLNNHNKFPRKANLKSNSKEDSMFSFFCVPLNFLYVVLTQGVVL